MSFFIWFARDYLSRLLWHAYSRWSDFWCEFWLEWHELNGTGLGGYQRIVLTADDYETILDLLREPPLANDKLKQLMSEIRR